MTLGAIHTVATDLFVIEGREPVAAAAVLRRGRQVVLLDSGAGPEQRRSICAIVASCGRIEELTLLSSSPTPVSDHNDDLIRGLPADRRRHLRPGNPIRAVEGSAAVPPEPYDTLGGPGWVRVGTSRWPGWPTDVAGLHVLRFDSHQPWTVAFHVRDCGVLIIPGLTDSDPRQVHPVATLAEQLQVISTGFGPPRDAADFRATAVPAPSAITTSRGRRS